MDLKEEIESLEQELLTLRITEGRLSARLLEAKRRQSQFGPPAPTAVVRSADARAQPAATAVAQDPLRPFAVGDRVRYPQSTRPVALGGTLGGTGIVVGYNRGSPPLVKIRPDSNPSGIFIQR